MGQLSQVLPFKKPLKLIGWWLPVALFLSAGAGLVLLIFATLIYQIIYLNRVYPGVSVMGLEVGGLTQPQLITAINSHIPEQLARSITIEAGGRSWDFTAQELGLRINAPIIARDVYAVGRQGHFVADLITQLNLLTTPREFGPLLWYDSGPTNLALQQIAQEIDFPPQDARLIIHPDGRVEVMPARRGRRLHLEASRAAIEAALFRGQEARVTATIQEILPAVPDVEKARRQAENLLAGPLVFRTTGPEGEVQSWKLAPADVAALLKVVERVDQAGQTQIDLEADLAKFTPYLEEFAQAVYRPSRNARLAFDDQQGRVVVSEAGQAGARLDREALVQFLPGFIEQPTPIIDLPVLQTPPAISAETIDSLGITHLVSQETSYFQGSSSERVHNIALAASKFDGVLVAPGEVFSFNDHLGEVSGQTGYYDSLIIFGDRTAVGIGGGVCQVSTTVFRAAFFGGFDIVERWAHGYRVSWYEINAGPGLDATIFSPQVDFRFRNDSAAYLLIETETDAAAGTLTFRFYGTPTQREVIVSEPEETNLVKPEAPLYEEDPTLPKGVVKQVDWAKDGLEVRVTRLVKEGDKVIHRDEIISHYRPWRSVFKVGSGAG
jgi:vancomycin resistance protein YoaR